MGRSTGAFAQGHPALGLKRQHRGAVEHVHSAFWGGGSQKSAVGTFAKVHLTLGAVYRHFCAGPPALGLKRLHRGAGREHVRSAFGEEGMYAEHFVGQPAATSGLFIADFAANFWSVAAFTA